MQRKFTHEINRAQALEILKQYEAGSTPAELAKIFAMEVDTIWRKIILARRTRKRKAEARA